MKKKKITNEISNITVEINSVRRKFIIMRRSVDLVLGLLSYESKEGRGTRKTMTVHKIKMYNIRGVI